MTCPGGFLRHWRLSGAIWLLAMLAGCSDDELVSSQTKVVAVQDAGDISVPIQDTTTPTMGPDTAAPADTGPDASTDEDTAGPPDAAPDLADAADVSPPSDAVDAVDWADGATEDSGPGDTQSTQNDALDGVGQDGLGAGDGSTDGAPAEDGSADTFDTFDTFDVFDALDAQPTDTLGNCPPGLTVQSQCLHWGVCTSGVTLSCASGTAVCSYAGVQLFEELELSCDGLDNDCNGLTDDDLPLPPLDLGVGVCADLKPICNGVKGWSLPPISSVPGWQALETACDGLDNDCDGDTDWIITPPPKSSLPGICAQAYKVCGGAAGWQNPELSQVQGWQEVETACDNQDNDCDGLTDESVTKPNPPGSGVGLPSLGVCAGAPLLCAAGQWQAPDYAVWSANLPGAVSPTWEATETTCDGLDNDCNGITDDLAGPSPQASLHTGVCSGSVQICAGPQGWAEPNPETISQYQAGPEVICDGLDNDCDGETDENAACPLWQVGGRSVGPLVLSPDQSQLAWITQTGVHVVDAMSGAHLYDDLGHPERISNLAFSPDGSSMASTGSSSVLRIVPTGYFLGPPSGWPVLAQVTKAQQTWTALAWHPDGTALALGTAAGTLASWTAQGGDTPPIAAHKQAITALAFASIPNSNLHFLISGSQDGQVLARPWPGGTTTVLANLGVPILSLQAAPFGRVAITAQGLAGRVIDILSAKTVAYIPGTPTPVAARTSPDGQWLWSVDAVGTVTRWNPPAAGPPGQTPALLIANDMWTPPALLGADQALDLAVSASRVYVNAQATGPWSLWPQEKVWLRMDPGHAAGITDLALAPGQLATAGEDGSVRLWNPSGALVAALLGHEGPVRSVALGPKLAISAAMDYTTRMWNLQDPEAPFNFQTFGLGGPWAEDLALPTDPTSCWAAAGSAVLRVALSGSPTGQKLQAAAMGGQASRIALSPQGERLAVGSLGIAGAPQYRVISTSSLITLWSRNDLPGTLRSVAWSPDGTLLALAGGPGHLLVVTSATGETLWELPGHTQDVAAVAFDPSGLRLLSASADGTARVWGVSGPSAGAVLAVWTRHCPSPCQGVGLTGAGWLPATWAPGGALAVTTGDDGSLMNWVAPAL